MLLRTTFAAFLALALAGPVLLPVAELLRHPDAVPTFDDLGRLLSLAGNTVALAAGAVLVAGPAGLAGAVLLERGPVPGRGLLRTLVLAGLFVPLPVVASAWQVVLGAWLPPLTLAPGDVAWRPWAEGLLPAAWVHGMAGLPWVVWVAGAGLRAADRALEDDALLSGGPAAVVRRVLLPRAAVAAVAAVGWVAAQTTTEIAVTDPMMVRTFAEEVYTRLVSASGGLAGAVAVAVPAWAAAAVVGGWAAARTLPAFGQPPDDAGPPTELRFGPGVAAASAGLLWGGAAVVAGLPLAALVWKAGGGGTLGGWTPTFLAGELGKVARTDGGVLLGSLGAAVGVGAVAAGLAWVACQWAVTHRGFGRFLFALCVMLAVAPGPVVGLGLKQTINLLMDAEDAVFAAAGLSPTFPPVRSALYDQPSPLPAGWAAVVRLFPVAVAALWPAVRGVPRGLLDAAAVDGLGVVGRWHLVLIPLTGPAAVRAALAVAALALGEVSAGKLVNPPFRPVYVLRLFDQMHYGADSTVATLCLLQVGGTAMVFGLLLAAVTPRS